ncbi:MAG TPA: hypothetical protein VGO11_09365 [Chthoniobacteraceae bacterium]|jgi:hypothetical protein|nr:hypothetical protein [Chthoniobacteraceae bacterium]
MYNLLTSLAGAGLLAIALANFFAPRMLKYGENLARVSPIVRQIFLVHSAYIVAVLLGQAALCFAFPEELAGRSALGRALSAFFALFWLTRFVLQAGYYDRAAKGEHPRLNLLFLAAFLFLGCVFALLAIRAPLQPSL